jgi:hypothetical protein
MAGDKAEDAPADDKKKEPEKGDSPESVESGGDEKSFDNFMSGTLPSGKKRKCTDLGCLIMVVS